MDIVHMQSSTICGRCVGRQGSDVIVSVFALCSRVVYWFCLVYCLVSSLSDSVTYNNVIIIILAMQFWMYRLSVASAPLNGFIFCALVWVRYASNRWRNKSPNNDKSLLHSAVHVYERGYAASAASWANFSCDNV